MALLSFQGISGHRSEILPVAFKQICVQCYEVGTKIACFPCYPGVCVGAKFNFMTVLIFFQLYFNNKIHRSGKLIERFLMRERRYDQLSLAV